jgi:hypothetical protein
VVDIHVSLRSATHHGARCRAQVRRAIKHSDRPASPATDDLEQRVSNFAALARADECLMW